MSLFSTPVVSLTESLGAPGGGTSSPVDTNGANFIVLAIGYAGAGSTPTVSDSKGNTYTPLTPATFSDSYCRFYFAENPTVGSGHTWTVTGANSYPSISMQAWANALTASVFDQQNAGSTTPSYTATSVQPGSVTPGSNNQLIVTAVSNYADMSNVSRSINAGFTISGQVGNVPAISYPLALAYLVQTTAAAVNPTWSWSSSERANSVIATFKSSGGGGGSSRPMRLAGAGGGLVGSGGGLGS